MAVASVFILYLGRELTFFRDEWEFVLYRDGHDLENYLSSHAGHLSVWITASFLFLFKAVGLAHYEAYQVMGLCAHLACAGLVFVLIRERVGAAAGLAATAIVLLLGSAWMDILWPFQIGFTGSIASGLIAFWLLDRDTLRADLAACVLLVFSLGWSGAAIPFVVGSAAGLLVRGRLIRRLWVVGAPAALYLAWSLEMGHQDIDYAGNLPKVPAYLFDIAGAGVAGLTGLPQEVGVVLAPVLLALCLYRIWRLGPDSALASQALTALLVFWLLTAVARAGDADPAAPRYVYPSVVLLLILGAGVAKPGTLPRRAEWGIVLLACVSVAINVPKLVDGSEELRETARAVAGDLAAVEILRTTIDPNFTPYMRAFGMPAAAYLAAVDRFGSSPAYSPDELLGGSASAARRADITLVQGGGLAIAAAAPRCRGAAQVPDSSLTLSPGVTTIENRGETPLTLSARRFSDRWHLPLTSVPPRGSVGLRVVRDLAPQVPWRLRMAGDLGMVRLCQVPTPAGGPDVSAG